jgi:hypothetical protein
LLRVHHFNLEDLAAEPVVLEDDMTSTLVDLASIETTEELVGEASELDFVVFKLWRSCHKSVWMW